MPYESEVHQIWPRQEYDAYEQRIEELRNADKIGQATAYAIGHEPEPLPEPEVGGYVPESLPDIASLQKALGDRAELSPHDIEELARDKKIQPYDPPEYFVRIPL